MATRIFQMNQTLRQPVDISSAFFWHIPQPQFLNFVVNLAKNSLLLRYIILVVFLHDINIRI